MTRWLPVPGYEGLYEVSDEGCVRRQGRILKTLAAPTGHLSVTLSKQSRKRQVSVHRLVLTAFVGPPPGGMEARHYPDRDPANNRLENLSWATRLVNVWDRREHGTDNTGERHGMAVLTWEAVRSIRKSPIKNQSEIARRFGVSQWTVSTILRGEAWKDGSVV
jgi:hypothetical protein